MSKKPKVSRHRVPISVFARSEEITPEYQAEIDRAMEKASRQYEKAKKAAESALRRKERADRNRRLAEEQRKSKAERVKAQRELDRRIAEYEAAWKEFQRLDYMVREKPVPNNSKRGERAFVTGGQENPRAIAG